MLTAIDDKGRRFVLHKGHSANYLKTLRENQCFFCEVCHEPVTLKVGECISWHFAHKPNSQCHGENEPESTIHREGKEALYDWLKNQGNSPILEQYFPGIKQRADIGLPHTSPPLVLEYQCSTLTPNRFAERNKGYSTIQMQSIWILGQNRYQRFGQHIFKWMQTDQLMLREKDGRQYAIFYDGRTHQFIILYDFWSLSGSKVIASNMATPLSNLDVHLLIQPQIVPQNSESKQKVWLQQKEKWRTYSGPVKSKFARYIHTMCRSHGINFNCFPSYVGLPIENDLLIASPTYLWQAYLILQFLYQRPIGTTFSILTIQNDFYRLAKKGILTLRHPPKPQSLTNSIKRYLSALKRFSIIKQTKNNQYKLTQSVQWKPKDLVEFRREDAAYLWRWLEMKI